MPRRLAKLRIFALSAFICGGAAAPTQAQFIFGPGTPQEETSAEIRDLNWMNNTFLDKQRLHADQLIRSNFGRQLRQNRADLALIQRVIDEEIVDLDDEESLQALGTALGDVFAREHRKLNWKVYEDELAASHAVCLDDSQHCLFPITMLSRRVKVGLKPNVEQVFEASLSSIKPYFPHVPYSRD